MLVLSRELFNKAVNLKRQGHYAEAIKIYRGEIHKMKQARDFDEFTTYARAMAKCFYLNNEFDKALKCYHAIIQFNILANGDVIYEDLRTKNPRIFKWICEWGQEIGYTIVANRKAENKGFFSFLSGDPKDPTYANAIAGKGGKYDGEKYLKDGSEWILKKLLEKADIDSFANLVADILLD